MSAIGNALVESAASAAVQNSGKVVDYAINRILDMFFGSQKDYNKKFVEDYHNEMLRIVDKTAIPTQSQAVMLPEKSPAKAALEEIDQINNLITNSVKSLEEAQGITRCSVCKRDIGEALDVISKKTNHVRNAGSRLLALTMLKERGDLPPTITWDDLTQKQKRMIDSMIDILPEGVDSKRPKAARKKYNTQSNSSSRRKKNVAKART